MAGFRLTNGTSGCPPTEAPPADYEIPFRFDDAGRLWITSCFKGFRYLGYARHDISTLITLDSASTPVSADADIVSGAGINAGTFTSKTIINDTGCDMGILLGYNMDVDMSITAASLMKWSLSGRWNGVHQSLCSVSSVCNTSIAGNNRHLATASVMPHDIAIDAGGAASLVLAPGGSAIVGARLFMQYIIGTATVADSLHSSYSAVRIYGYTL